MDPEIQRLERQDCERQADRLGIPFVPGVLLSELRTLIAARESAMGNRAFELVNGKWEIQGDLPDGLMLVNGAFVAPNKAPQPDCFGELWDGTPGGSEECVKCVFSPVCMEAMAKITFTAAQASLGGKATLPELATLCEVSEQSILKLMGRMSGQAPEDAPKQKKKPPPEPVEAVVGKVEEPAPERDAFAAVEEDVDPTLDEPRDAEAAAPAEVPAVKRKRGRPRKIKPALSDIKAHVARVNPEPVVVDVPVVKRKRGRPPKVKTVSPGVSEVSANSENGAEPPKKKNPARVVDDEAVENPPMAPPAKSAKVGASPQKALMALCATTVPVRAGARRGISWGKDTWLPRWTREREKYPEFKTCLPGSAITVARNGKTHSVQVFHGYYEIRGKQCATLTEAARIAAGNNNWNARRWWRVAQFTKTRTKKKRAT